MKLFNTLNSAKSAWTNGTVPGKARTMPLSNILVAFLLASFVNQSVGQSTNYCVCDAGKTRRFTGTFDAVVGGTSYSCSVSITDAGMASICSSPNPFNEACCVATASPTASPAGASSAASVDWYLEPAYVNLNNQFDATAEMYIAMYYNVGKGAGVTVNYFNSNCTIPVTNGLLRSQHGVNINTPRNWLAISLYINETAIVNSALWTQAVGSSTARFDLCVRVDLVDGSGTSYNFNEQKLYTTVDLSQGFTVTGVDVNREGATEQGTSSDTDFGLSVCKCDANGDCSTESLFQGDAMSICIKPPPTGNIQVATVKNMYYYQATAQGATPVFNTSVVVGGTAANAVTEVTYNAGVAVVKTQLSSVLFTPANIDKNIYGSGTVLIRFGSGRARLLRFVVDNSVDQVGSSASRKMQDQTNEQQAGFSFSIDLAPRELEQAPKAEDANTGVIIGGIVGLIAGVAVIVALVLAARRKKDDNDDRKEEAKGVRVPEVN